MKIETVTQKILTADDGMYLTNGETYGKTVVLPVGADPSAWYEVTEAEKEAAEKESLNNAAILGDTNNDYEAM